MIASVLQFGERCFQLLQGKGIGAHSIRLEVMAARRFLRDSAIVFDVGANKGLYTKALLASAAARIAEVHLFEPSQTNADLLAALSDPRIVINRIALGARTETRRLHADHPGSSLGSLYNRDLRHRGIALDTGEDVKVERLDDYVDRAKIDRIDLLKLDVEGHEYEVLLGAEQSLKKTIQTIQFEFGGCNIDSRTYFRDFWTILRDHGFRIASLSPLFGLLEIEAYSERLESFATTNYFAFR